MGWFNLVVITLCICTGTLPFQWTSDHSEDVRVVNICRGHDLHLPWNFTLAHGEQVASIQWYFRGQSEEMVAMVNSHGQFVPMPAFANRVEFVPPAGIVVKNIVPSDSGNYTVEVSSNGGPNSFPDQRLTAVVDVTDPPSSDHEVLTATQERSAVYNNHTGDLAIGLTCGQFISLGYPPVDVVWTTPTGERKASTSFKNGSFLLTLDNPVKGGNYSCSIDPSSPAAACLSGSSGLLQRADVIVDEVGARLTLIEARQEAEITRLQQQNQQLTSHVHALEVTDANLTSALHNLEGANSNLTSSVHTLEATDANLTSSLHALEVANADLVAKDANLTSYIHALEHNLTQHIHDYDQLVQGPCADGNHTVLNDAWRDVNQGYGTHCDRVTLTAGWYRFLLNGANAVMPTSCLPQGGRCGTAAAIWLDLQGQSLPGLGQEVQGQACGVYTGACCEYQKTPIIIRNCGHFFLYHLQVTGCNNAYCATLH